KPAQLESLAAEALLRRCSLRRRNANESTNPEFPLSWERPAARVVVPRECCDAGLSSRSHIWPRGRSFLARSEWQLEYAQCLDINESTTRTRVWCSLGGRRTGAWSLSP